MKFDRSGVLQVKAPKFMLSSQIQKFLDKNSQWIEKQQAVMREREVEKKRYLFGEEIDCNKGEYKTQGRSEIFEAFYKSQARSYIVPRCEELAGKYGFQFENIRITSAMTRWGSCSSKKNLNFSYRLVMAPKECIDYVIIHELCHLKQMNHSAKFWAEVSNIMPEYKRYEKHLKEFGWRYVV